MYQFRSNAPRPLRDKLKFHKHKWEHRLTLVILVLLALGSLFLTGLDSILQNHHKEN